MILHFLKSAWRNILRNKVFASLNMLGVALAIAVTAMILFWVVDELSYDRCHEDLEQIYSVYEHQQYSGSQELYTYCTPFPLSSYLEEQFPQVIHASTFFTIGLNSVIHEEEEYRELSIYMADSNFLKVFSFEVIQGDPAAMYEPGKLAITEHLARRIFGDESPLGRTLIIYGTHEFSIEAIVSHPQNNSTIEFDILLPIETAQAMGANLEAWGNNWPRTALKLAPQADEIRLDTAIRELLVERGQTNTTLYLFPFAKSRLFNISGDNNRVQYIYQFLAIALIIILIASINFINAATAASEGRRGEIGIRKVQGASRGMLVRQFIHEQGLMILLSLIFASLLFFLLTPVFNELSGKELDASVFRNGLYLLLLVLLVLGTLLLSVSYPAWYISRFNPVQALQKQLPLRRSRVNFRSLLVVLQFTLSIILIISTITVSVQLKYISQHDLGYDHENLVYISLDDASKMHHGVLSAAYREMPGVEQVTCSDKLPFWGGNSSWGYQWTGKDPENRVLICRMYVDEHYFETLGIPLAEGRGFSDAAIKNASNENGDVEVILNQEAIRRMEMEEAVGKEFGRSDYMARIVGVSQDFHFETLKHGIEPMVMVPLREAPDVIIMRLDPVRMFGTLELIKEKWDEIIPDNNCEIGFFDERLEAMYRSELRISGLFRAFSLIAIFIASIGLFGLSVFAIERKRKEIGIRKVNGSSISQVLLLLNGAFLKWILLAFVLASPVAWFVMDGWLQNFAFRTRISWWIFVLAALLATTIALLTVSWQSLRAARRNPSEVLRYE